MNSSDLQDSTILILEDEVLLRKQIAGFLEKQGAQITSASSVAQARKLIAESHFDFALIDVNLPDGLGTDLLREKVFSPNTGVIVMTAEGNVAGAVEAIRLGALDYLVKPFDPGELPLVIQRTRRYKQSERIEEHRRDDSAREREGFFFGGSLERLQTQLEKILAADKRMEERLPPVLIEGETGTGKTTIARWIHHHGPRAQQPLVEVNCSALPEALAESELFGHERGAFTDARSARIGLFEAAHGGTLFLDELPSLQSPLQAKVLKAIEDHKIRRLGGNKEIAVDTRIIAATNLNLQEAITSGQFREDLFHRLNLYRISIPPLRDRGNDIARLAERILKQHCKRHRLPERIITESGKKHLQNYSWPGNVRELSHEIERALVFEDSEQLSFDQLGSFPQTSSAVQQSGILPQDQWFNPDFVFPDQGFSLEDGINRIIQHALNQTNQNVSAAARLLGVSRDYIRYRLQSTKPRD